jgi:hypothetical protein
MQKGFLGLPDIRDKALHSFTLVTLQKSTWRNIPEGLNLHQYCCENLKSHMVQELAPALLPQDYTT